MNQNDKTPERPVMDVKEIQTMLGISKDLAYKLCNEGRFKVKKLGRRTLVNRQSFHEWLDNGEMFSVMRLHY